MARFRTDGPRSPDWEAAGITGKVNLYYFTGTIQDGLLTIPRDRDAVFWVRKSYERAMAESEFPDIRKMTSYRDAAAVTGKVNKPVYLELDTVTLAQYRRMKKHFCIFRRAAARRTGGKGTVGKKPVRIFPHGKGGNDPPACTGRLRPGPPHGRHRRTDAHCRSLFGDGEGRPPGAHAFWDV